MNFRSIVFLSMLSISMTQAQKSDFYLLKTYHFSTNEQAERLSNYLENAYVPALHKLGFNQIGVFSLVGNDTAAQKSMYVLIPGQDLSAMLQIEDKLAEDEQHLKNGMDYWNTRHDKPVYDRIESSLIKAFKFHPKMQTPKLKNAKKERIYELRSYEGASEQLYRKKVEMFNEGGEIKIFEDLNFNAVFYGETLIGAHTPNLVYMTTFENMEDRNAHWDAFRVAPAWKVLSAKEEYKNTVSKNNTYLLTPTDFSDY